MSNMGTLVLNRFAALQSQVGALPFEVAAIARGNGGRCKVPEAGGDGNAVLEGETRGLGKVIVWNRPHASDQGIERKSDVSTIGA